MSNSIRLFCAAAALGCSAPGTWVASASASPILFLESNVDATVFAEVANGPTESDSFSAVDVAVYDEYISVASHDPWDYSLYTAAGANAFVQVASNVVVANGFADAAAWGSSSASLYGAADASSSFRLKFALATPAALQGGALLYSFLWDGDAALVWSLEGSGGPLYGDSITGEDHSFTPIAFVLPAGTYELSASVVVHTELAGGAYSSAFGSWSIDFTVTPIPESSSAALAALGAAFLAGWPLSRRLTA